MGECNPMFIKSVQPGISDDGRWVCLTVAGDETGETDVLIPLPAFRAALFSLARLGVDLGHPSLRHEAVPANEQQLPLDGYLVSSSQGMVTVTLDFGDGVRQVVAKAAPLMACSLADKLIEVAAQAVGSESTHDA